jgi:ferritin-like metal-binding protein YciE
MAAKARNLSDLFLETLRDIYDAEKQILGALPKMAKAAESDDLREAFELHRDQTEEQVKRLEKVFAIAGQAARPKRCEAMRSILAEGEKAIARFGGTDALDAALVGSAEAVEHYEISHYGTLKSWAEQLGMDEAVGLLDETLREEETTARDLETLGALGSQASTGFGAAENRTNRQSMSSSLRGGGVQPEVNEMDRSYRDRDEQGRFISDDERGYRSRSRNGDDYRSSRSSSYDDDRGRGGWFGDPEGHSEASRRGWENRDDDRNYRRSRPDEDYRDYREYRSRSRNGDRGQGGWFGDPEGHSEAAEKGWRRGREPGGWFGDPEGHSEASRRAWERGREPGGWFGDPEGHSEASRRAWERGREPGGWFGDSEGHSEASRKGWDRGREPGGWFGDPEGHSEASRRGWENRDDERSYRSSSRDDDDRRSYRSRSRDYDDDRRRSR